MNLTEQRISELLSELASARAQYPPFKSLAEAMLAVREEYKELEREDL